MMKRNIITLMKENVDPIDVMDVSCSVGILGSLCNVMGFQLILGNVVGNSCEYYSKLSLPTFWVYSKCSE
jgi:hypothetical protein